MKHYEITAIMFIIIGIVAVLGGCVAKNIFHETPQQVEEVEEAILKDGLAIVGAS